VLILGVTPELCDLPWPAGSTVRAVDRSKEMLTHVWPGRPSDVCQADWRDLPWAEASFDLVLCDGGWSLLDHPDGQRSLAEGLERVISPGGLFITRLFVPPDQPEQAQAVIEDLEAGKIRDLNVLKLRLGMALTRSSTDGVQLDAVWHALREATGEWPDLAARLGWSLPHLSAIDAYRGSSATYHFVSVTEFMSTLGDGPFVLDEVCHPTYLLGERCPTVTVSRSA
jgi:SAM-dependent methyltransferase